MVLFFSALIAWQNSFSVPMLLDDRFAIDYNSSVQHLWPLGPVLKPPGHATTVGRPLLNLSFALNYAFNGTRVQGYHAFSVVIHALAGIALLGVARRTLLLPKLRDKFGKVALPLAFFIALLWMLHPLQTESITYISQRAEALMGLCYFLTLYGLIRGATSPAPALSYGLAIAACAWGMATKESIVTAPVVVLLYDRVFLADTFKETWRQRGWFYLGLAATWLVLAYCMVFLHDEFHGIGYKGGFTWWTYALTECRVVLLYLKLVIWPQPLVFDYGPEIMLTRVGQAAPYALLLAGLLAGIVVSWRRWPIGAFLGAWFFLILTPTSSVVPVITQPMAENRVYLPLAGLVALGVAGLYARIGRKSFAVFLIVAVGWGGLTLHRNRDYQSELAIWTDTVAKCPQNARAHINLANVLTDSPDDRAEAIVQYEAALRIDPDADEAHNNLANILAVTPGRLPDAIAHYEAMVRLNRHAPEAHYNLANALMKDPVRWPEAIAHYETMLRLKPDNLGVHLTLANLLVNLPGRIPDAIAHYETALRLNPDLAEVHGNLGYLLSKQPGRLPEAIAHYERALQLEPGLAETHNNLGNALLEIPGRRSDAIAHYERALQLKPDYAYAHFNLAGALLETPGRKSEAIGHYEEAVRLKPDYTFAHFNLGMILADIPSRRAEAIAHLETALRLKPDLAPARKTLERLRTAQTVAP